MGHQNVNPARLVFAKSKQVAFYTHIQHGTMAFVSGSASTLFIFKIYLYLNIDRVSVARQDPDQGIHGDRTLTRVSMETGP